MLLLSKSLLLMLTGEVVVVMVKGGSCRVPSLRLLPSFGGVDTTEDLGHVGPFAHDRRRLASSVQLMLRLPLCIAR